MSINGRVCEQGGEIGLVGLLAEGIFHDMATSLVACPKCGNTYERTEINLLVHNDGNFTCACGEVVETWSRTRIPVFRKVKDATASGLQHAVDTVVIGSRALRTSRPRAAVARESSRGALSRPSWNGRFQSQPRATVERSACFGVREPQPFSMIVGWQHEDIKLATRGY